MSDFPVDNLPNYTLGEIAEEVVKARLGGRDIIDLSQFNPNLDPPARAIDKLVQNVLLPHNHRYSSSQGITSLREAIVQHYLEQFSVELDSESEAIVTIGTKEGLAHLLLGMLNPGDSVLIPAPSYPMHLSAVYIARGTPLEFTMPVHAADVLSDSSDLFFDNLENAYLNSSNSPKALLFNFPHNPTTTVVSLSFFERLLDFAKKKDIFLVHDFAYADLCFDSYLAPSILQVSGAKDVAIEFYSISKAFNVAGWRVGFALGSSKLVSVLRKIKSCLDFGIFQPIQIAAIEALKDREHNVKERNFIYASRRDILVQGLRELGWEVSSPEATGFVWAKLPADLQNLGSIEASRFILDTADVAVSPGAGFGEVADMYLRFSLVENESRIRMALNKLGKLVK